MVDLIGVLSRLFLKSEHRGVIHRHWHETDELDSLLQDPENKKRLECATVIPKMFQKRLSRAQTLMDKIITMHPIRIAFHKLTRNVQEQRQTEMKQKMKKEKAKMKKDKRREKKKIQTETEMMEKKYGMHIARCQSFVGKLLILIAQRKLQTIHKSKDTLGNFILAQMSLQILNKTKTDKSDNNPILQLITNSYETCSDDHPSLDVTSMNPWELILHMTPKQMEEFGNNAHLVLSRKPMNLLISGIGYMYIRTLKKNMIKCAFNRWKIKSKLISQAIKQKITKEKTEKRSERLENRYVYDEYDKFMDNVDLD
jgi:hypothetical protein